MTITVPCATCSGTGWATHEDRHTETNRDTCRTCGGSGQVPARPGESRETSWPFAVPGAHPDTPPPSGNVPKGSSGEIEGLKADVALLLDQAVGHRVCWHEQSEDPGAAAARILSRITRPSSGGGLEDLSRKATQGQWLPDVHVYYDEDGGPSEDRTEGVMVLDCDDLPDSIIQCSEDDARFIVALVNAYRTGHLVSRPTHLEA